MTRFNNVNSGSATAGSENKMEGNNNNDSGSAQRCVRCGSGRGSESNDVSKIREREEDYSEQSGNSSSNNRRGDSSMCKNLQQSQRRQQQWTNYLHLAIMAISLIQWLFVINSVIVVMSPPVVSAIDLNPHGGFYQREGGRNEFYSVGSSSQQQQSDNAEDFNDMIMTCSRPTKSSRAAKNLAIKQLDIPCDMGDKKSAWCNLPGDKYPWHAVRRFVFENQGLMRRMYGEVRQLSLLQMEFEDDMDDEEEEERHGPPRAPPLSEDHKRNSILTEVLEESLPQILSKTPPGDQILLRDHNPARSTPGTFPTSSVVPIMDTSSPGTTSASTTTPVMVSTSSEEQLNATEVLTGVTVDSISASGDANATTTIFLGETDTASTPGITASTNIARNDLVDELVTEDATQSTASVDITEIENDNTSVDGETTITTTEEMPSTNINNEQIGGVEVGPEQLIQLGITPNQAQQKQTDDLIESIIGATGMGSDETHDFLNLDKNHIVYFDDVGKNRRPVAGNGDQSVGTVVGEAYLPQSQQPGKLKAVNACPVKEEVVAPYWANNTRGEILALLNLYPFEQYIHWERCNNENKQMFCRPGCRCEQQYRLHRLLAFDPTNECRGIFSDWFRFPSCCVCRCYLNEYELMMLNAAGQEPSASPSSAAAAAAAAKSRTSDRIRSPRKVLLQQLVDGPDVHGVDDMHFFYKMGLSHEHNHGAQPRKKRSLSAADLL